MTDQQQAARLESLLSGMAVPVRVRVPAKDAASLPSVPAAVGDRLVMLSADSGLEFSCALDQPAGRELLMMAAALASGNGGGGAVRDAASVYRAAMLGELSSAELLSRSRELQIPQNTDRCLFVFRGSEEDEPVYDLLSPVIPLEDRDAFVQPDRCTAVLIKDLRGFETADDIDQFGQALWDTLIVDTPHRMNVGISTRFSDVTELHSRYAESLEAIEVGQRFHREDGVWSYDRLVLERFLMEASPAACRRYYERLFSPENKALFNDEMMYTIDMFFRQDLNMSETARQLYIHRNTLVYRLDKVQKATGLNLRSFKDAVTFRILTELKHCSGGPDD